jgi:hypothetical protein
MTKDEELQNLRDAFEHLKASIIMSSRGKLITVIPQDARIFLIESILEADRMAEVGLIEFFTEQANGNKGTNSTARTSIPKSINSMAEISTISGTSEDPE